MRSDVLLKEKNLYLPHPIHTSIRGHKTEVPLWCGTWIQRAAVMITAIVLIVSLSCGEGRAYVISDDTDIILSWRSQYCDVSMPQLIDYRTQTFYITLLLPSFSETNWMLPFTPEFIEGENYILLDSRGVRPIPGFSGTLDVNYKITPVKTENSTCWFPEWEDQTFIRTVTLTVVPTTVPSWFDEEWYVQTHSDVARQIEMSAYNSGWHHFRYEGIIKYKDPSPSIKLNDIRLLYPDLYNAAQHGNYETALDLLAAWLEENPGDPLQMFFEESWYLDENPDVDEAVQNGVFESGSEHFRKHGILEGRDPSPSVSLLEMMSSDPVFAATVLTGDAYEAMGAFFLNIGTAGLHDALDTALMDYFDEDYYLNQNPDVAEAIRSPWLPSAWRHFITWGIMEKRSPCASVDLQDVYMFNTEYARAVDDNHLLAANTHRLAAKQALVDYLTIIDDVFDEISYLVNNPDVASAVENGLFTSGWDHFSHYGILEPGRIEPDDPMIRTARENSTFVSNALDSGEMIAQTYPVATRELFSYHWFEIKEPFRPKVVEGYYLSRYPDVAAAIEEGVFESAYDHFRLHGIFELRNPGRWIHMEPHYANCPRFKDALETGKPFDPAWVLYNASALCWSN